MRLSSVFDAVKMINLHPPSPVARSYSRHLLHSWPYHKTYIFLPTSKNADEWPVMSSIFYRREIKEKALRTEIVVISLFDTDVVNEHAMVVDDLAQPPDVAEYDERGREGRLQEILPDQSVAIEAKEFLRIVLNLLECVTEQKHNTFNKNKSFESILYHAANVAIN